MTTSCDSQPVPRHVEQPGLEHEFPRGTEYRDTESWSDSDSREISRRKSGFRPPMDVLRRDVKSFDDLRKPFKQRNHRLKRIANPNPILPTYLGSTASDFGDRTDAKPSSSSLEELCTNCLGISIEKMAQTGGYKHSRVSELLGSSGWCKLCRLMAYVLRFWQWTKCTADRYQIAVSFRNPGDHTEVRLDSIQGRQPCFRTGHFNSRPQFVDGFSGLYVEVIDLHSWEPPEEILTYEGIGVQILQPFLGSDGSKLTSIGSVSLFCLTEEHDPATEFGIKYVRQIGSDTSSSRSLDIAAGWLASCLSAENPPKLEDWKPPGLFRKIEPYSGHEAGGSKLVASNKEVESLTTQNPLRLIEIQPDARGKVTCVRVIHTDDHHYHYAALSYCWGKAQPGDSRPWQTKYESLKCHFQGINIRHLPQTLQDAIFICERLHISYLWVDSLCIIQDSPSDWAAEAAKMSSIYLGSLLTICLSASVSAESGCFDNEVQRIVDLGDSHWMTIDTRMRDGRSSRLHISSCPTLPTPFDDEVLRGVLGQRAWALQEHIMPQRTLYITSKQLLWECKHCRLREDNYPQEQGDSLYPICDYGFPLDATAIIEMWYRRVVEDYTRRQLTYEKDKLIAISALARATYLNRHIDYVAGLWRDCIVPGLLWKRQGLGSKSRTYSCPTWSWASQNSAVGYWCATPSIYGVKPSELFPRVRDVSWATKRENPFGDVLFAHVDLETTIALGTVLRDNTLNKRRFEMRENDSHTLIITGSDQNQLPYTNTVMDDANRGGRNIVVANMGHCFLLLEPPSLSSEEYRRVGIAIPNFRFGKWKQFHMDDLTRGWTQRTIRLV